MLHRGNYLTMHHGFVQHETERRPLHADGITELLARERLRVINDLEFDRQRTGLSLEQLHELCSSGQMIPAAEALQLGPIVEVGETLLTRSNRPD